MTEHYSSDPGTGCALTVLMGLEIFVCAIVGIVSGELLLWILVAIALVAGTLSWVASS